MDYCNSFVMVLTLNRNAQQVAAILVKHRCELVQMLLP